MTLRVRTHANPLRRFSDLAPPDWAQVFANPARPFALELGSAKGEFLRAHAAAYPDWNILGTEIRKPLAIGGHDLLDASALTNATLVWGNIAGRVAEFTPTGRIDAVYIFFPDPWFKNRHHKRRVVQIPLLTELANLMPSGAPIHLLTDQAPLDAWNLDVFAASPAFQADEPGELVARSAWEEHCIATGRSFIRRCWRRL